MKRRAEEPESILVKGAREHNLAIEHLEIPKKQLVVFTGVSGSGKSSLAFDTLYAEGQRRYVESLSSYARQFLGQMDKPKYEQIRGLSPTIAIEQKTASSNPRFCTSSKRSRNSPLRPRTSGASTSMRVSSGQASTASVICDALWRETGLPSLGQCGVPTRAQSRRR